jgi:hypothetical protein
VGGGQRQDKVRGTKDEVRRNTDGCERRVLCLVETYPAAILQADALQDILLSFVVMHSVTWEIHMISGALIPKGK